MSDQLVDILEREPWSVQLRRILAGLRAPRDSGEYRYARWSLVRILGPICFSLVSSVLLVIMALTFKVESGKQGKEIQVEVTMVTPETIELDKVDIEELTKDQVDLPDLPPSTDVAPGPVSDAVADTPSDDYSAPSDTPADGVNGDDDTPMVKFAPVVTKSPLVFKGLYGNRSKGGRDLALKMYGGGGGGGGGGSGGRSEESVNKALQWLKKMQKENGAWPGPEVAMAGLAVLTFLAHGETTTSAEYGKTVERGIKFLLSVQNPDTGRFIADPYANGIAVYAMSEAYGLTKILQVREAMEKGVQSVIDGQQEEGGFNYGYAKYAKGAKGARFDMSVTGWQIQAFKAAKMAGSTNTNLEKAIKKGIDFLKNQAFAANGSGFVYSGTPGAQAAAGGTWALTGAGTLCLQLLGQSKATQVRKSLTVLEATEFTWPKDGKSTVPVYGGYYVTQAKFQEGGDAWKKWNSQFARELVNSQEPDGHWANGDYEESHVKSQNVYTTTLCALMLQVYYRYLPTYQQVKAEEEPAALGTSSDDVAIKIL